MAASRLRHSFSIRDQAEAWVMNATPDGTLFGIAGSWVVDLLQLEPASDIPSDGFDSGGISRELIGVPASC